jgi:hypothetical protein
MKDKYTGDVNDYIKYGLLRILAGRTMKCDVCWMLTPDDDRGDGRLIRYASQPDTWRHHDPVLFDRLSKWLAASPPRSTRWVEGSGLLPSARFYAEILADSSDARAGYFTKFLRVVRPGNLVFFDPDNGMAVRSTSKGRRGSSRYLWWDEIEAVYNRGSSVIVYQHFPRVSRKPYIASLAKEFRRHCPSAAVSAFASSRVVYFLCARPEHAAEFRGKNSAVEKHWGNVLTITLF